MDKNRLLTCPYDSSHRIFEHRMSKHLIKCKLNNDHIQLLTCPYNTIHRIKPLEYEVIYFIYFYKQNIIFIIVYFKHHRNTY